MSFGILFPNKLWVSAKRNPFIDSNWCSYIWHTFGDFFETHTGDSDLFVMFIGFQFRVLFLGRRHRFFFSAHACTCYLFFCTQWWRLKKLKQIQWLSVRFQIWVSLCCPQLWGSAFLHVVPYFVCNKNTLGQNGEMTWNSQRSLWLLLIIWWRLMKRHHWHFCGCRSVLLLGLRSMQKTA